jgi:hypothetical protein
MCNLSDGDAKQIQDQDISLHRFLSGRSMQWAQAASAILHSSQPDSYLNSNI